MPDTYSLQRAVCLKGIGLTAGKKKERKKRGIINDFDFKSASKKMDYHFNFYPLFLATEVRISLAQDGGLNNHSALTPDAEYVDFRSGRPVY